MENQEIYNGKQLKFIRLGGFAVLFGLVIHIIANMVLKTLPSDAFTPKELSQYLSDEASTWEVVNGIRYMAIVCMVIFGSALFIKTKMKRNINSMGWGIVGLMGCALMMGNLLLANGIEILAFSNYNGVSDEPETFWMLFYLSRVLFTGEIIAWAILILGFSMSGLYSKTIPKWIIILGLLSSFFCILSMVFIVNILKGGSAGILIEIGSLTGLLWFIIIGVNMLLLKKSKIK